MDPPKMMPSSPNNKVFDQLIDAKTAQSPDRQRSWELAPPSAASLSSPPNKSISSNNGRAEEQKPLPLNSPNDKLFSHVEKAENNNNLLPTIMKNEQQQRQQQQPAMMQSSQQQNHPPPTPTSATAMQDTVERIVNAVENREASARESALVNGTTSQQQILEVTHGGPFTSTELSQLALLCSSGFSSSSSSNKTIGGANQSSQWAAVDGDLLASLTPLLRAHVTSAMRVDLVGEGLDVIAKTVKAESSPEKTSRPVITIHQVRVCVQ